MNLYNIKRQLEMLRCSEHHVGATFYIQGDNVKSDNICCEEFRIVITNSMQGIVGNEIKSSIKKMADDFNRKSSWIKMSVK